MVEIYKIWFLKHTVKMQVTHQQYFLKITEQKKEPPETNKKNKLIF